MRLSWMDVECRYCGASKGEQCFLRSGKTTQSHAIRIQDHRQSHPECYYTQAEIDAAKARAKDTLAKLRVE